MLKRKFKIIFALSFLIILCVTASVKAQQGSETFIVKSDGNAGELNSARLDYLTTEQQTTNERIFVIARLGRGETARPLNLRRLRSARSYLIKMRSVKNDRIVFAEGEKIAGEGRLEFYLGSKLVLVSLAPRGKNVALVCCVN